MSAGQLWHSLRNADGTWQGFFGLITGQEGNKPGQFLDVRCAGVFTSLHVVGSVNGELWHTIRYPNTWQKTFGLIESQAKNNPGPFTVFDCAGIQSDLHVVGLANGHLWHTIRFGATEKWQTEFGSIDGVTDPPESSWTYVACAAIGESLHILGMVSGALFHTVRNPEGTWQKTWDYYNPSNPLPLWAISCSGVGTELQIAINSGDTLYHTIMNPGPTWQSFWGSITGQMGGKPQHVTDFVSVGCAGIGSALHVVSRGDTHNVPPANPTFTLWHTIRNPNTWKKPYDLIEAHIPGNNPQIDLISCAGVGTSLHLVGTSAW